MNVLEKILEEIEERKQEHLCNAELEIEETVNRMEELNWVCALIYYMEEVKKANVQTNDDWIPYTEQNIPKKEGIYLVTCDNKEYPVKRMRFKENLWYWYYGIYDGRISAWKPLPEPYRAADSKQDWKEHILKIKLFRNGKKN